MTTAPEVSVESRETVWRGRTQLDVVRFRSRRFDGRMSDLRTWEVWLRGHAVGVLPYDPATDQLVMIEQFRFPAMLAGVDPVMLEIPAASATRARRRSRPPPARCRRRWALRPTACTGSAGSC